MSPEQVDGSEYLDGRSDIYSLGCVLFEMLVGEPPFRGSTLTAVIANRLSTPGPVGAGGPRARSRGGGRRGAEGDGHPAGRSVHAPPRQFAEALGTPATVAIAVGAAQAMVQERHRARSRSRCCRSRT